MDEDEWTDLNFGNSTNCANTSEDSISDLESDNENQVVFTSGWGVVQSWIKEAKKKIPDMQRRLDLLL